MEPTLENISDYDTLKGEKKKVVYGVIIAGVLIGSVYALFGNVYSSPKGALKVNDSVKMIPVQ